MAAVDVDSLTIAYGSVTAVDNLSFTAEAGEVTCVLGPNGAGKTSTIEALEGLRRPTFGRLSVIGFDPVADHATLTTRVGVMLQDGGIHPAVRVGEALRHAAALYRDPLRPRVLIDRLGLTGLERRTYRQLSGGEQRRLALALALVGRPEVAFLDEPTTGVDPAGRQVIRQVVADLRNDGVAVVLTTHDLDEAERVADRVVIIVDGRLVATGTVDELTRSGDGDEQVRFRAPAGLDRDSLARHLDDVTVTEAAPGEYVVGTAPTPRVVAALTSWLADHDLPLADLHAGRQRLEDVYLRLTAPDATSPAGQGPPAGQPAADADDDELGDDQPGDDQAGDDQPDDHQAGDDQPDDQAGDDRADDDAAAPAVSGVDPAAEPQEGDVPAAPHAGTAGDTADRPAPPQVAAGSPDSSQEGSVAPTRDGDDIGDDPVATATPRGTAESTAEAFEAFWGKRTLDGPAGWPDDTTPPPAADRRDGP